MNELAQLPVVFWIVAPLTILFAYTVFGMSGFGSTVIAVPILANWLPLTYLVPLMALGDIVAAASMGGANRRQASVPELKRLLPFMIAGIALGVTVLVNVPQLPLKGVLLDVPQGKRARIEVLGADSRVLAGYRVYPAPLHQAGANNQVAEVFSWDEAAYRENAYYPAVAAELSSEYVFRGHRQPRRKAGRREPAWPPRPR